jgi:pyruvate ferredoxin oxidoreductase alpha subunit
MNDAQYTVICMGTICGTARTVIDKLRKEGKKVGMIKVRTFRPFPIQCIINATKGLKGIAVLDRSISLGYKGPLYTEVRNTLCNSKTIINGFIVGLGGRDVKPLHIEKSLNDLKINKRTQWLK